MAFARSIRLCLTNMLAAGLLLAAMPGASSAAELSSTFLTSSTGNGTINAGDTIQFEVSITTTLGFDYNDILFSLSGDIVGALSSSSPGVWDDVQGIVVDWEWNYVPGTPSVDFATNGTILPFPNHSPGSPVLLSQGARGVDTTGDGGTNIIGTVTIMANNVVGGGVPVLGRVEYQGGAFMLPGFDAFQGFGGQDTVIISPATYTVASESVPALGAIGMALLLAALGVTAYLRLRAVPA
jgi:hypothetical protein